MHLIQEEMTKDEQVSLCGQAVRQRLRVAILSPGVEKHRRDSRWGWRWRNESQWASSPRRSNLRGSRCSPFALGSEVDPRITRPSPVATPDLLSETRAFETTAESPSGPLECPFAMEESSSNNVRPNPAVFRNIRQILVLPEFPLTPLAQLRFLKLRKFQNAFPNFLKFSVKIIFLYLIYRNNLFP